MKLTVEQKIRVKKIIEDLEKLRKERGEDTLQIAEYNGGNDDGEISASDKEIQEIFGHDHFFEWVYLNNQLLDYGSWAGDFYASGRIYWNGEKFSYEGWYEEPQGHDTEGEHKPDLD